MVRRPADDNNDKRMLCHEPNRTYTIYYFLQAINAHTAHQTATITLAPIDTIFI